MLCCLMTWSSVTAKTYRHTHTGSLPILDCKQLIPLEGKMSFIHFVISGELVLYASVKKLIDVND